MPNRMLVEQTKTDKLTEEEIAKLQAEHTSDYKKAALLNIKDCRKSMRRGYRSNRDPLIKSIASSDIDKD